MRKPIIAITPEAAPQDVELSGFVFHMNYAKSVETNQQYIWDFGGIPFISGIVSTEEQADEVMSVCDGLFVTGGDDVTPSLYGEETLPVCGATSEARDKSDVLLYKAALKAGKPVLAVCRGSQICNVVHGGTLWQDIMSQTGTSVLHPDYDVRYVSGNEDDQAHEVKIEEGSPLYNITGGRTSARVNSLHHQGVKDLGEGVKVQASAPDGMTESWYLDSETQYVRAYQWHPEFTASNPLKNQIGADFIKACIDNMNK